MTISFNSIPSTLRVPFVTAEFDASQASQGPALLSYRALLIGQKTASGAWAANSLQRITKADDCIAGAGRGSQLHRMATAFFKNNTVTEVWVGVLADDGAGVAASGTITVSGPATAAGTIYLYLGGVLVTVGVNSGDSANSIASAINTAINANTDLPVTSSVAAAVVTVTFRHKGLTGNEYDMRANYVLGQAYPAGVSLAFVALASGTTAPVLTTLIANMGDQWFQIWAHPYTDATSLTAIENELSSRFGPMRMIDGVAVTSKAGTFATLSTLGGGRNSQHSLIFGQPGKNPLTPPMEHAAAMAGIIAQYGAIDPARPFQTLPDKHSLPPVDADLFTLTERDLLLKTAIATTKVVATQCQIDRAITTYRLNAAGAADTAYLDATTMLTLLYLRYSWRVRMTSRYPRHKLANDGTRFGAGQAVITPKDGKAEAIGWFKQMERLGLVEGLDQFKQDLVVERNAGDPNRLDFLLPPDLINQLVVNAAKIAFRL